MMTRKRDAEESSHSIFLRYYPRFSWQDWGKPQETHDSWYSGWIWLQKLLNTRLYMLTNWPQCLVAPC